MRGDDPADRGRRESGVVRQHGQREALWRCLPALHGAAHQPTGLVVCQRPALEREGTDDDRFAFPPGLVGVYRQKNVADDTADVFLVLLIAAAEARAVLLNTIQHLVELAGDLELLQLRPYRWPATLSLQFDRGPWL